MPVEIPLHPLEHNSKQSRKMLRETIRKNGEVDLSTLIRMARRERLNFGKTGDIFDVLLEWRDQKKISIEMRGFEDESQRLRIVVVSKIPQGKSPRSPLE